MYSDAAFQVQRLHQVAHSKLEYLHSVSVNALDAYTMAWPSCNKAALNPVFDASVYKM